MRYSASEKREIIDLVENSSLPVRRTLDQLHIPKSTFYGWYERFPEDGDDALVDGQPRSKQVWNRIPDSIRDQILELALQKPGAPPGNWRCATLRPRATSFRSPVFTGC